jgi:hypothetical protein
MTRIGIITLLFLLESFTASIVRAQYGPGGIGYEDASEEGQPELVLWLKADQLLLSDGDEVDVWEDQSGNDHHALSGGDAGPLFSSSGINDMPAIVFNGDSWFKVPEKSNLDGGPGISIFVVIQPLAIDQGGGMKMITKRNHWNLWGAGLSKETCKYSFNLDFHGRDEDQYIMAHVNGNFPDNKVETEAIYGDSSKVLLVNYNYTGQYAAIRVNGLNTSGNKPNPNYAVTQIGDLEDYDNEVTIAAAKYEPQINDESPIGDYLKGKIAEIAMFRLGLDSTRLQIVENYFAAKYKVNTGPDKLFQDTVFRYNLIAIGTANGRDFHRESGNGVLLLKDKNESLNTTGEFLFCADDNVPISWTQKNIPEKWESRWTRIWKVEKRGEVDAELWFSFVEAGISLSKNKEYGLLYTSDVLNDFTTLSEKGSAKFGNLIFHLSNEELADGYYTIAEKTVNTDLSKHLFPEIEVFPNPFNNRIKIYGIQTETNLRITMSELSGRVVREYNTLRITKEGLILNDLDNLEEGFYILSVTVGGSVKSYSIIKTK